MKNKIVIFTLGIAMLSSLAQAKDNNATTSAATPIAKTAPIVPTATPVVEAAETVPVATPVANSGAELALVEKMLEEYKKIQLSGDLEKTLEFIYPPVFTVMPKEELRKSFKRAVENGKMPKIHVLNQSIVSEIKTFDKGLYLVVEYDMNMTLDAVPPIPKDDDIEAERINKMLNDPKEFAQFKGFMTNMLKMSMGGRATIVSEEENSLEFDIHKPGHYFMIKENGKEWKMLDIMPETAHQFKDILPKEIVKNEKSFFKFMHPNKNKMKQTPKTAPAVKEPAAKK